MSSLRELVAEAIKNKNRINTLWSSLQLMLESRQVVMSELGPDALPQLMETRKYTAENIEALVEKLVESVKKAGGNVYIARTAEEASNYIAGLARSRGVKLVVKSKSMTTEEIMLNKVLEEAGVEVVETDLGEWIVQLAGHRPSHIIAPAVHLSRAEIAEILSSRLGIRVDPDPTAITRTAQRVLREKFLSADMGITGANILVAETGAAMIVTNEGNGRFVTTFPKILVTVAGVEKIVRDWRDAINILRVLARSATGKQTSIYVSIFGPRRTSIRGGEDSEYHLVLLDNGRISAEKSPWLSETLRCIRCSACFNVCPTYRIVGGHVFGDIYTGPIGVLWTAVTRGLERAAEISPLCVSCGLCKETCPVSIDIPMTISWIKNEKGNKTRTDWGLSMYELYTKAGSRMSGLFNWIGKSKIARKLMEMIVGIDSRRPLPEFIGGSFFEHIPTNGVKDGNLKVAYFVDTYAAYIDWRLAEKAVKILSYLGVEVVVPPQEGSGMPLIQYGFQEKAKRIAERNISSLYPYVEDGYKIICTEPSAAYCIKAAYPKLLGTQEAEAVAKNTYDYIDYIVRTGLYKKLKPGTTDGSAVFYHYPCHGRTAAPGAPTVKLLENLGYRVYTRDYGCCGMAGTWGMRKGPIGYDMSIEIGRRVVEMIQSTGAKTIVTESSVCPIQFRQLTSLEIKHPVQIIAEKLKL
ncbi:MAG: LUD domain-containing protein [Nitrososphaerota archaeon]